MIIKCDKCLTSFRLPEEKIKPEGTKVRCSKCKNVFTVLPPKEESKKSQEFDEKTRIAFIPTPFGDDRDDDLPVNIRRHKDGDSKITSLDSIGHGIALSSPEIRAIQDTEQDLKAIMSALSPEVEIQNLQVEEHQTLSPLQEGYAATLQNEMEPAIESQPQLETIPDNLDILLNQIDDVASPQQKETLNGDLPDLTDLLSPQAQENKTTQPPENNTLDISEPGQFLPPIKIEEPDKNIPQEVPSTSKSDSISEQDKSSNDIDAIFDALFSEATQTEQRSPQEKPKQRKTMLYMESVPVASTSQQASPDTDHTPSQQGDMLEITPNKPIQPLPPQINSSPLDDELSIIKEPIKAESPPAASQGRPTPNWGDDLLAEISVSTTPQNEEPPTLDNLNIAFGELGSDLPSPDRDRFALNANRSDDLLSQMDSIDTTPSPLISPSLPQTDRAEIKRPEPRDKMELVTEGEVRKDSEKKRTTAPPPIKPATIAIKDIRRSREKETIRWGFTIVLFSIVLFTSLSPQTTFPNIKTGISSILNHPTLARSVTISNLYYEQINNKETLLIFTGTINLRKATTPDNIRLLFKIRELSGADIIQFEYPVTYSEDFNSAMEISSNDELKDFIEKNRVRIFTQRKNRFIAPLILENIDINSIDIKVELKENPQ